MDAIAANKNMVSHILDMVAWLKLRCLSYSTSAPIFTMLVRICTGMRTDSMPSTVSSTVTSTSEDNIPDVLMSLDKRELQTLAVEHTNSDRLCMKRDTEQRHEENVKISRITSTKTVSVCAAVDCFLARTESKLPDFYSLYLPSSTYQGSPTLNIHRMLDTSHVQPVHSKETFRMILSVGVGLLTSALSNA